ncbi:hypothetical protein ACJX0J_022800, partial [Zea mays]
MVELQHKPIYHPVAPSPASRHRPLQLQHHNKNVCLYMSKVKKFILYGQKTNKSLKAQIVVHEIDHVTQLEKGPYTKLLKISVMDAVEEGMKGANLIENHTFLAADIQHVNLELDRVGIAMGLGKRNEHDNLVQAISF